MDWTSSDLMVCEALAPMVLEGWYVENHKNTFAALAQRPKKYSSRTPLRPVMRAAFLAPKADDGKKKLVTHARWLKTDHPHAAAGLLEGLDEMFTVNGLGLTPPLIRCLATTNIIENPNGTLRDITHRVCRWRSTDIGDALDRSGVSGGRTAFQQNSGAS